MVGLMGAAIGAWPVFDDQARPWALLFYTAILLTACAWSMALAMMDVWATRRHFRRKRLKHLAKHLQATVESSMGESAEAEG